MTLNQLIESLLLARSLFGENQGFQNLGRDEQTQVTESMTVVFGHVCSESQSEFEIMPLPKTISN